MPHDRTHVINRWPSLTSHVCRRKLNEIIVLEKSIKLEKEKQMMHEQHVMKRGELLLNFKWVELTSCRWYIKCQSHMSIWFMSIFADSQFSTSLTWWGMLARQTFTSSSSFPRWIFDCPFWASTRICRIYRQSRRIRVRGKWKFSQYILYFNAILLSSLPQFPCW